MATITSHRTTSPRPSTETDRRHLLTPSIAPSDSASLRTTLNDGDGDRTQRAQSPTSTRAPDQRRQTEPTIAQQQPYRGFPSEAEYLAALHAWAESQKYIHNADTSLIGFYGQTTMEEYASRPKPQLGLRRKLQERKEKKEAARRASAV